MRRLWIPILTLVVVALVIVGFRLRSAGEAERPSGMQTVIAERGPIRVIVSASGVLEPVYQVEVKSKASGLIERMPVEEGDTVEGQQLLAELDKTEAQSDYDQARANLASAEANLQYLEKHLARQQELYNRGLISDLEMEEGKLELVRAESQKVAAEAMVTTAKQRLDDTTVRSPIDGVVLLKSVEAGQVISSGINSYTGGTTIAVVADMSQMLVKTSVDEVDIGSVEIGQSASVMPDAFPEWVSQGKVIRIAPLGRVEQNVTTFEVTVQIPNPDLKLKAGMNCTVDLKVADRSDAVLVPVEAVGNARTLAGWQVLLPDLEVPDGLQAGIENQSSQQFVLVVDGGRPTVRLVGVGLNDMERVEITEGLREGEEVLIASHSRALQARAEFQERIKNRSMGGFRRSN
jgi:HlyD family secretion protein